jgi:hypothetical protein
MVQRCTNPKACGWKYYGGKGISIAPEWATFEQFFADMGPKPTPEHTINRKDGRKNYSKENCEWATKLEQGQNKSNNRNLTLNGETHSVSAWARKLGVKRTLLFDRFQMGWSDERILTTPMDTTPTRMIEFRGKSQSVISWSNEIGIPRHVLYGRLANGWSVERTLTTKTMTRAESSRLGGIAVHKREKLITVASPGHQLSLRLLPEL